MDEVLFRLRCIWLLKNHQTLLGSASTWQDGDSITNQVNWVNHEQGAWKPQASG